jgi:hypothetical protein
MVVLSKKKTEAQSAEWRVGCEGSDEKVKRITCNVYNVEVRIIFHT